ncbi:MAG: phage tail protein [Candidatus Promineifilaceae bacterium]
MPNPVFESVSPPFTSFRFEVILNLNKPMNGLSNPVCNAAFAECNGLEISMTPKSFNEGGANQVQTHLKDKVTYGQLSLNRGMTASKHLWVWMEAAGSPGVDARASGTIKMLNPDGSTAAVFKLFDVLPVSLRGPGLNASNGQVAVEEMTLTYGRLSNGDSGGTGAGGSINFSAGFGVGVNASASFSAGGSVSASAGVSVSGGPGLSGGVSAGASADISLG